MKFLLLLVTAAVGVLLLLMPHYTHAQCNDATKMSALVDSLFNSVSALPKGPGFSKLLTFKQNACLVLIGDNVDNGLMAAATLGAGKLLVTTNYELVKNYNGFERNNLRNNFHTNMRSWLKGGSTAVWKVCTITSSSQMIACINDPTMKTLLYYYGTTLDLSPQDEAAVEAWITSGEGTLIYAFRQDAFEASTVESASKIPLYSVILAAGVAFEGVSASAPANIPPPTNATELIDQNLYTVNSALTWDNFENSTLLSKARDLVFNSERYFPPYVSSKFFQVFEDFAVSMETNMKPWPNATWSSLTYVPTSTRKRNMYKIYYAMMRAQIWHQVHPTAAAYPGDVANPAVRTSNKSFSFTSQTFRHFYPTCLYLFPGKVMTITVTNPDGDDTWRDFQLYIGSDTDNLPYSKTKLARIPLVYYRENLVDRVFSMVWATGGLVYFYAPDGLNKNLMVTISGDVSDTPCIDAINDDVATINAVWTARCTNSPGLTADFYGEYIRFAIPVTPGICDFTGQHYRDLLLKYDRAIQAAHELRGGNACRQEAVHIMIQLYIGALHDGFPIAAKAQFGKATNSKYALNTLINTGDWPILHEIGHQVDQALMYQKETVETSANIFALFNYVRWIYHENLGDVFKISQTLSSSKLKKWLLNPSFTSGNYNKWTRFLIFFQLIRDFGWSCQREVYRSLVEDPNPPSGSDAERNDLVMRWSNLVEYNLCPLFEFWHWPVTTACSNINPIFPPYLPNDVITSMTEAANLTASVLADYDSISRSVPAGYGDSTCPTFTILPAP